MSNPENFKLGSTNKLSYAPFKKKYMKQLEKAAGSEAKAKEIFERIEEVIPVQFIRGELLEKQKQALGSKSRG